ncbi:MAG: PHP domain-containing protein [Candidatus Hydrogenedentota bacterium]
MITSRPAPVPQDLHIHTTFSEGDGAIVPEQTVELVAGLGHAATIGISDHFEFLGDRLPEYIATVRAHGLHAGTEVQHPEIAETAAQTDVDYFIMHCEDAPAFYKMAERFLETGKPVIIAHPMLFDTDLERVPPGCHLEVNNRYVWRDDWRTRLAPYVNRFSWVISSDAHQPHWLNQNVARYAAAELGIRETLLFAGHPVAHTL